jgi:hypothetical protein
MPPFFALTTALLCAAGLWVSPQAQEPRNPLNIPPPEKPKTPVVVKTGPTTFRIGPLMVDTAKREVIATGSINDVTVLEFVANTRNGLKAYESAMTIDVDAVTFNTALLLIGLDPARARVPAHHFDPKPPEGDPVDMFVEWTAGNQQKSARVEDLLFDVRTKTTMPAGPWTYTGSTFVDMGNGQKTFLSESDGVLIGFVHSPAPLIENPRDGAVNAYGSLVLNPNLGLKAAMPIKLIVRALPRK